MTTSHDNVTDIEKFVDDYIAVYEDAPYWGGPTMYPAPLTIKQVKALRDTIATLRKQLENAREALRPFAHLATGEVADSQNDSAVFILAMGKKRFAAVSMRSLRKAREALKGPQ